MALGNDDLCFLKRDAAKKKEKCNADRILQVHLKVVTPLVRGCENVGLKSQYQSFKYHLLVSC